MDTTMTHSADLTTFATIETYARALGGAADQPVAVTVTIQITAGAVRVSSHGGIPLCPADAIRRQIRPLELASCGTVEQERVVAALTAARWCVKQ